MSAPASIPSRNGIPEFRPYTYRGTGTDTLTAWMDERKPRKDRKDNKPRRTRTGLQPCGTIGAYRRHQRHGEEPCDACRYALARYEKRRRAAA
jgi:hypothetical protein